MSLILWALQILRAVGRSVCDSRSMDRSLMLKASALARGTRRIDLSILQDDPKSDLESDILEAEFVDIPALSEPDVDDAIEETLPAVIEPSRVTPGRARRATDAYAPAREARRPIIAIG